MAWLRVDDKFVRHPKVIALTDREFRVHMLALSYCAEYGTAGDLPASVLFSLGATAKVRARLIAVGLWDDDAGDLSIHDFTTYNPLDPTSAERKRRFRNAHRNGNGTADEDSEP